MPHPKLERLLISLCEFHQWQWWNGFRIGQRHGGKACGCIIPFGFIDGNCLNYCRTGEKHHGKACICGVSLELIGRGSRVAIAPERGTVAGPPSASFLGGSLVAVEKAIELEKCTVARPASSSWSLGFSLGKELLLQSCRGCKQSSLCPAG